MKKINDATVKWGILGVGDVCEVKSAPAMQVIENSELVAVMRRNRAKAKDYAQRHGVKKWYDDADALINDPEVNAIYIATPPDAHAELTLKAAKARKPIYVEKPMAKTLAECHQMLTACHDANVPLYVAYYRRTLPNFIRLKELIDSKVIGDVRLVKIELYKTPQPDIVANTDSNWRVDPAIAGGGYFYDLAAHQLDYLDFVFGAIKSVSGQAANHTNLYSAADIVTGSFVFENGIQCVGSWCFTVDESAVKDELTVIGTKGKLSIPFFGAPEIRLETSDIKEPQIFTFKLPKHIQQPLIQTVVDDLLGKGVCPSMGESALRTNWVMEEMTKNYYNASDRMTRSHLITT
ncbi:MAG: Gfo/Idh/MocA family oxidoreductase [Bacteroidota bacterium]